MKKTVLLLVLLFATSISFSQLINNGDFSNWQVSNYYEYPDEWFIFNDDNAANLIVEKSSLAQQGNYSVKLNTITLGSEILTGAAVYGIIDEDEFKGLPFNLTGNIFHFWYQSNIQPGDMGLMILILYSNGSQIDSLAYPIMSSQSNWTHAMVPVNSSLIQPDSMFLGFLSSVPDFFGGNPSPGSWLRLDNLYFTMGMDPTPLPVPNFSFENWSVAAAEDPDGWQTSNSEHYLILNDTSNVNKSTDYHSSPFASRLEVLDIEGIKMGASLKYTNSNFPYQPSKFYFYYKYLPVGLDTGYINISFTNNGSYVGGVGLPTNGQQLSWEEVELDILYNGIPDKVEVEFQAGSNSGSVLYIDDARFGCINPQNLYGEFTNSTSIQTSWSAGGVETQWQLQWGLQGFPLGTGTNVIVNTNPSHIIDGLNYLNNYDFYVRSICNAGDSSEWVGPYGICIGQDVVIVQDFESVPNNGYPDCWHKYTTGWSQIEALDCCEPHTGNKFLKMSLEGLKTSLIASPLINDDMDTLFISFYAKKNSPQNATLYLGTMSNPSNPATFDTLNAFSLSNVYENYTHYFDNYSGNDKYISILLSTDNGANTEIFMDDIVIDFLPSCIPPLNINANNITLNSADITWDTGGQGLWDIVYGELGFDPYTSGYSDYSITNNSYNLTLLNSGATYDVYLRSDCGIYGLSDWHKINFTTLCSDAHVPIVEGFDNNYVTDLPNCWLSLIEGWGEVFATQYGGNLSQRAANMRMNHNNDSIYFISPYIIENIEDLYVSFDAREQTYDPILQQGTALLTLGTITDPNDASTFTPLQNFPLTNNYDTFQYSFDNYSGSDKRIAFRLKTTNQIYTEIFIDNILVDEVPICLTPDGLNTLNTTINSAVIEWTSTAGEFEIEYGMAPYTFTGIPDSSGITVDTFALSSLNHGTTYEYRVKAVCGPGLESGWSITGSFTTDCDTYQYLHENFDNVSTSQMPNCWTAINTGNSNAFIGAHGSVYFTFPHALLLNNGNLVSSGAQLMAVTPHLDSINQHQIRFFASTNLSSSVLQVGTMSDPNDPLTFAHLQDITIGNNFQEYYVSLSNVTATDGYFAFRHTNPDGGNEEILAVDEFFYEPAESCPRPTALNSNPVNTSSVMLKWTENGNASLWQMEWGIQGFQLGNGNSLNVTQPAKMLFGLTPNTPYEFYVRAICDTVGGDTSLWAGPFAFITDYMCINNTIYGQTPSPISNFLWSAEDMNYTVFQQFTGIGSVFDGLHLWGIQAFWDGSASSECYQEPMDFEVKVFQDNNGQIGTELASFIRSVTPDSTKSTMGLGYQIYEFTLQFPQYFNVADGWFSIRSINSPTCFSLFANTTNPVAQGTLLRVNSITNDTLSYDPLAFCLVNNTHVVNYLSGSNGHLTGQTSQIVLRAGTTSSVLAVADTCYEFVEWSDGRTDNPRFDGPVFHNITVTALFDLKNTMFYDTVYICPGDTFFFGDIQQQVLTEEGNYSGSFITSMGCDSIINLNLIHHPVYEFEQIETICDGDTFSWRGNNYTTENTYFDSLTSVYGCDSVFILQLIVFPSYEYVHHVEICDGDSLTWRGNSYTVQGTYYDSLFTVNGCDSVFTLHLSINPVYEFTHIEQICNNDTFTWHGNDYTAQGLYYDSLTTVNGCDSVYKLHLIILPTYETTEIEHICNGDTFIWRGNSYTDQGMYFDSLLTVQGCDSVFKLHLIVHPTFEFLHTEHICTGDTFNWHGNTYNSQGHYYDSLQTTYGCDSVYILHLIINQPFEFTHQEEICDGDTFSWHGSNFTTQGLYYDSLQTVFGCDSVYILNLSVNPAFEFLQTDTICNGDTITWRGNNYSSQGMYYDSLLSIHGCDSIYKLHLIVNPSFEIIHTEHLCHGDTFTWRGNDYTLAGTYHDSLLTVHGCDSVFTLVLNISTVDVSVSQNGVNLTSNAINSTYQWVDCDNNYNLINGETNALFTATANGNYAVIITHNNCVDTSACYNVTGVFTISGRSAFPINIFPNPNNGIFTLNLSEATYISVFNTLGTVVYSGIYAEGTHLFNLKHLSDGVYIVRSESVHTSERIKVVIQK
ncbi:MAG: choice-of-anchor J domain-containing protein [Bacteroidales bacterium]|nr:choice-of-anchor J domain-containing protein [Bacteroidales bacterium]